MQVQVDGQTAALGTVVSDQGWVLTKNTETSQGQVTNAVYGFTSMLIKLLGDERPDAIAVAIVYQKKKARAVGHAATFDIDALLSGDAAP